MRDTMGVDAGTLGTKAALFDALGVCVASATAEYPLCRPTAGRTGAATDRWEACLAASARLWTGQKKSRFPASEETGCCTCLYAYSAIR